MNGALRLRRAGFSPLQHPNWCGRWKISVRTGVRELKRRERLSADRVGGGECSGARPSGRFNVRIGDGVRSFLRVLAGVS